MGLPITEALSLAVQIAGALGAAHRAGVTHRDLKPGNIMVTKAGAKVLDFWLAKHEAGGAGRAGAAVAQGFSPANVSMLPTMSAALTAQGTILGTLQYMAPEQLEGKDSEFKNSSDWSQDGRFILFVGLSPKTGSDLWVLPLFDDRKPFVVAQTAFNETNGRYSPTADGPLANRTKAAGMKSTSSHFPARAPSRRSQRVEALFRSGVATGASCSTWGWTTA